MFVIELTPTNIHIVDAVSRKNTVKVKSAFSAPMPLGAYFNGYVKDYSSVAKAIRDEFLSRNIVKGEAYFVLDSTSVKSKDVTAPDESRQNVLSILNKEMADILASEAHVLDYVVYDRFREHGKWYLNCMLYALPREIVMEFIKLSEECDIRIKELDFHHNCISKLWELQEPKVRRSVPPEVRKQRTAKSNKKKQDMDVKMEEEEAWQAQRNFHVDQNLQLWVGVYQDSIRMDTNAIDGNCYSRTIPIGGGQQDVLTSDTEARKNQILFYMDQIQAFRQFIEISNRDQKLKVIQMYGDYENMEEIISILQQQTDCPVEPLRKPRQISGITDAEYPIYCTAIGALLRR